MKQWCHCCRAAAREDGAFQCQYWECSTPSTKVQTNWRSSEYAVSSGWYPPLRINVDIYYRTVKIVKSFCYTTKASPKHRSAFTLHIISLTPCLSNHSVGWRNSSCGSGNSSIEASPSSLIKYRKTHRHTVLLINPHSNIVSWIKFWISLSNCPSCHVSQKKGLWSSCE